MNVTFACPRCDRPARVGVEPEAGAIECPHCQAALALPAGSLADGTLTRCLICPCRDLYVRKDFPQRLGVALVVIGFVASSIAWYYYWTYLTFAILFGTALVDVLLYMLVGNALMCYRCGAQYRLVEGLDRYGAFNLETHERYRQEAARLASHQAAGQHAPPQPASSENTASRGDA